MVATIRRDQHRPSAIQPDDYQFVAVHYIGPSNGDLGQVLANAEARRQIMAHKQRTGGHTSRHDHGGTCHVCGATAFYLAVYYHPASNTYIECGEDCARKLDMGDVEAFNPLRRAMADARHAIAGKNKARLVLTEAGLGRAWDLYEADDDPSRTGELVACGAIIDRGADPTGQRTRYMNTRPFSTLMDVVGKLVKYGHISEKQERFCATLIDQIEHAQEYEAKRQAEKDAAKPCPTGRQRFAVEVIKVELREGTMYGPTLKMLAKHADGWKVWGTVPSGLEREPARGDRIELTATIEASTDDPKFGFYSRPAKAKLL